MAEIEKNSSWSDDAIREQIKASTEKMIEEGVVAVGTADTISNRPRVPRNLLLVGCGDGGCNIASAVRKAIPETYAIAYNTSRSAMDNIQADIRIIPNNEDGSGKVRSYSQNVFRAGSYKYLLESVQKTIDKAEDIEYVIVTTTADGGTGGGVSPMVAKYLSDNLDVQVIVLGVYPALSEDATAQFNAMQWQADIEKTNLPYIIMDNDIGEAKALTHMKVNQTAVEICQLLAGTQFGETNISSIDNRDVAMLISTLGKRMSMYTIAEKPAIGVSLDDFLMQRISDCKAMTPPVGVKGIGIFLKGPVDFIQKTDTSLVKFKNAVGDAAVQYIHLEESKDIRVAIMCTGCKEPVNRLAMMRQRYDDIQRSLQDNVSSTSMILEGIVNPLGENTKTKKKGNDVDLSALGM